MSPAEKGRRLADALFHWRDMQRQAREVADEWKTRVEAARGEVWRLTDDVRSGQGSLLDVLTQVEHVDPAPRAKPPDEPCSGVPCAAGHRWFTFEGGEERYCPGLPPTLNLDAELAPKKIAPRPRRAPAKNDG